MKITPELEAKLARKGHRVGDKIHNLEIVEVIPKKVLTYKLRVRCVCGQMRQNIPSLLGKFCSPECPQIRADRDARRTKAAQLANERSAAVDTRIAEALKTGWSINRIKLRFGCGSKRVHRVRVENNIPLPEPQPLLDYQCAFCRVVFQSRQTNRVCCSRQCQMLLINSLAKKDRKGLIFGKLTVLEPHPTRKRHWICQCACGGTACVHFSNLQSGRQKKCKECR